MESSFKIRPFYPAIIWSLLILLVSYSVLGLNIPTTIFNVFQTDKVGHFGIYAILALLIVYGLRKNGKVGGFLLFAVFLWCGFYGFLMEVLQYSFFPGRYFEIADIVANIIGSLIGLIFYLLFKQKLDSTIVDI